MIRMCGGRDSAVVAMSAFSDSGFEEDLQASGSELQGCDEEEEESCFFIQRHNQQHFLPYTCLARQPQVNPARSKPVSWLIAVHRRLKLSFKACCLAVNIMDCFLIMTSVAADCFQSLLIATKQVEVCSPQHLSLCCNSFSREQLCNLKCLILLRLRFRLAAPTHAFSLDYFTCTTGHQTDGAWKWLECRVCELGLADCTFNKYMPSVIVLCALKLAKDLLKTHSVQPRDSEAGSSKTLETLCIQEYPTFEAQLLFQRCTEDLKLLFLLIKMQSRTSYHYKPLY
uniref:Cyclin N-terminal domain-containing protein n=1 Tax=Cyprinus carpio carpio TaxID=630221 RepID=A0A8C1DD13_CYPCA